MMITKWKRPDQNAKVHEHFELKCKKCGSNNVVFNYEPECHYSEMTVDSASLTFGCNSCKENDLWLDTYAY